MAWNKYFSVEVPLLVTIFFCVIQSAVSINLYVYRVCYVVLEYNETLCSELGNKDNNDTKWLEPKVQPTVNIINMVDSETNNIATIIFSLFVGTLSDKFGRKPFLLFGFAGLILTNVVITLMIHFPHISPWWFIVSGIPSMITGGVFTFMILASSYLADVSTEKDRVIRLGLFQIILELSSVLGNLISSYLFYATSYETIYIMSSVALGISFLYTIFFIPESLKHEKQTFSIEEIKKAINFRDLIKNIIKKRPNNARRYIFAIIGINLIAGIPYGEMQIMNLFYRKKFYWTLTKITTVSSIFSFANILGTLCSTYLFYKLFKIKELHLCIFSIVLMAIANVVRGLAPNDYFLYVANTLGILNGTSSLMLRTVLSFIVEPKDMGKIFALNNITIYIDNIISSLVYPLVYNATLNTNSSTFNFISCGSNIVAGIMVFSLSRIKLPYYKAPEEEEQDPKDLKKSSVSQDTSSVHERVFNIRTSLDINEIRKLSLSPSVF